LARILEAAPLVGVGRISYGLYLFHIPIIYWLRPARLGWDAPGLTLLAAGLSIAAAVVSYYCVERPCLRLKGRLRAPDTLTPARADRASATSGEPLPALRRAA
jgi:peptidoglycan/LPS O-acetylase OafA/YrhL